MTETNFERIKYKSRKVPVVEVMFSLDEGKNFVNSKFFLDTGCEPSLMMQSNMIDFYNIDKRFLTDILISTATTKMGGSLSDQKLLSHNNVIIKQILVNNNNILEKPLHRQKLIFSENPKQCNLIGEPPFQKFKCIIDYGKETLDISLS